MQRVAEGITEISYFSATRRLRGPRRVGFRDPGADLLAREARVSTMVSGSPDNDEDFDDLVGVAGASPGSGPATTTQRSCSNLHLAW